MDQVALTVLVVAQARVLVVNGLPFSFISITFQNQFTHIPLRYADSDSDSSGHGSDTGN